ncbi:hypothetical protein ASE74_21760 [Pedobacter sp. Leaf216]|nr:hypothetical protein ASE74_21760 [Pedobacter sp. Leaf216]
MHKFCQSKSFGKQVPERYVRRLFRLFDAIFLAYTNALLQKRIFSAIRFKKIVLWYYSRLHIAWHNTNN